MTRTLSLLTPSGRLTLGSYLGALLPMSRRQEDAFYGVSDLHAMTTEHDPVRLRAYADETATLFLAVGLDRATLFRQSHVPAHAQLAYLLECVATTGELNRMIQFKEKGRGVDSTRVSLFTYPAADGGRHPAVPPGAGARGRRPAPARRADPRPGAAVQPALRRGLHGPGGGRPHGRHRPRDGPAAPGPQDVEVRGRGRLGLPARPARRRTPQGRPRGHRLGDRPGRGAPFPRQARRHQPPRHPGGVRRLGRRHRHLRGPQARR